MSVRLDSTGWTQGEQLREALEHSSTGFHLIVLQL